MNSSDSGPVVTAHAEAPTKTISAGGTNCAYRELGPKGGIPVLFFVHLAANLNNWDPPIVDPIAKTVPSVLSHELHARIPEVSSSSIPAPATAASSSTGRSSHPLPPRSWRRGSGRSILPEKNRNRSRRVDLSEAVRLPPSAVSRGV